MPHSRRSRQREGIPYTKVVLFLLVIGAAYWGIEYSRTSGAQSLTEGMAEPGYTPDIVVKAPFDGTRVYEYESSTLVLDTGTVLTLPGTPHPDRVQISLERGRVTAKVPKMRRGQEYVIRTFNATAGVRGTIFSVEIKGGYSTIVSVTEGLVEVWSMDSKGDTVLLSSGQSAIIDGMDLPRRTDSASLRDQSDMAYLYSAPDLKGLEKFARDELGLKPGARLTPETTSRPAGMVRDFDTKTLQGIDLPTFRGNGTWSSLFGFSGPVSITIDVKAGTFYGNYSGKGERAGVAANMAGTFSGKYLGDDKKGSLDGTVVFGVSNDQYQQEVPNLKGRVFGMLQNKTVTGSFEGAQTDGQFSVTVQLE